MNVVHLVGNVGADPEIRRTQDGRAIANIRLATSETWKDKATGERKERTEWHRVVCFQDGLSGVVEKYVNKGDKLAITGSLTTRKWQAQDGTDRYSTEVVMDKMEMLGSASGGTSRSSQPREREDRQGSGYGGGYGSQRDEPNDDIPW